MVVVPVNYVWGESQTIGMVKGYCLHPGRAILAKPRRALRRLFIMLNSLGTTRELSGVLEIEQHAMDVRLCPLAPVEPRQHAAGWILLGAIRGVALLA